MEFIYGKRVVSGEDIAINLGAVDSFRPEGRHGIAGAATVFTLRGGEVVRMIIPFDTVARNLKSALGVR